jgi:hypothetical protein
MEYFSVCSCNKNSFYISKTEGTHFQPENIGISNMVLQCDVSEQLKLLKNIQILFLYNMKNWCRFSQKKCKNVGIYYPVYTKLPSTSSVLTSKIRVTHCIIQNEIEMATMLLTTPLCHWCMCTGQWPATHIGMSVTNPYIWYEFPERSIVCCFAFCVEKNINQNFCDGKFMFEIMNFMLMFCKSHKAEIP